MWSDGSGTYSPSISSSIYKLRFSGLSDGVLDDLLQFHEHGWGSGSAIEQMERHGFDRLYISEEQHQLEIFARKGSTVIWLQYFGEEEAQSVLDAILKIV